MNQKLHLAFGAPNAIRSTVWRFWAAKDNVYVQSRMMGSSCKISLHCAPPGVCSWSITDEWIKKKLPSNFKNSQRHFHKWSIPTITSSSAGILCRIAIPFSEMRCLNNSENLSQILWCDTILPNEIGYFIVYLSPAIQHVSKLNAPYTFIRAFALQDSRNVVIFGDRETISETRQSELDRTKEQILRSMPKAEISKLKPEHRVVVVLSSKDGYPTFLEICPCATGTT